MGRKLLVGCADGEDLSSAYERRSRSAYRCEKQRMEDPGGGPPRGHGAQYRTIAMHGTTARSSPRLSSCSRRNKSRSYGSKLGLCLRTLCVGQTVYRCCRILGWLTLAIVGRVWGAQDEMPRCVAAADPIQMHHASPYSLPPSALRHALILFNAKENG